jgi:2-oxoglutarate ferredoxin oxidoreductase subunit gamma
LRKSDINSSDRYEIRLSGSGGQGLIFAGTILAEAVGVYHGKNVIQTQSYGPEARGGASRSDIVISSDEIFYPKCMKLDLLLALTQEACDKFYMELKEDGILIVDSGLVAQLPTGKVYAFPFTQLSRDKEGTPMVANIMALGTVAKLSKIVPQTALIEAVRKKAPKGTEERNLRALQIGFELPGKKRSKKKK